MKKRFTWIVIGILVILLAIWGYKTYQNDNDRTEYEKPQPISQFDTQYDVIVIGGEPEGVAAAVSAARNGAKTLLVESRKELGGLFTYGMLNFLDIPQGENGESVSKGIFAEWHSLVGGQSAFGIEEAKAAFKQLVDGEKNLTLSTETEIVASTIDANHVTAVKLKNEFGEFEVSGKTFIDATQDADFAAMSNVPYFVGGEDIGIADKKMAVTLMIHLKNVNWDKVKETAKSKKFGEAVVTDSAAWGFATLHRAYPAVEENTRLRGLNIAKVNDDYFINALQIFGVNGIDAQSKQEGIERGKRETENILAYLQKEFSGFEEAEIASFPTELYVRETRHIWAEHQLSMADVWTNRDYWDSIALGAYPVDIQAQTLKDYGFVVAAPKQYAIPFRSLVPKDIDGLLVVGRSAGFSSIAAGSARIVPTGMATGEAAGVAATLAIKEDISFRDMSKNKELIETLRESLSEQGAFVEHMETDYPYEGEWYDESIQTLMNYGLIYGSYDNNLKVDELATSHAFMDLLKNTIQRANSVEFELLKSKIEKVTSEVMAEKDAPLERDAAAEILVELLIEETGSNSWSALMEKGIIGKELIERLQENHELTLKEVYALNADVINYLK